MDGMGWEMLEGEKKLHRSSHSLVLESPSQPFPTMRFSLIAVVAIAALAAPALAGA